MSRSCGFGNGDIGGKSQLKYNQTNQNLISPLYKIGGCEMINITQRAKKALKKILTANVDLSQGRLRLMDRGQGKLGLGVDIEMPGDELVKYNGSTVLIIERGLVANLKGVTLDVEDSLEGSKLVIDYK